MIRDPDGQDSWEFPNENCGRWETVVTQAMTRTTPKTDVLSMTDHDIPIELRFTVALEALRILVDACTMTGITSDGGKHYGVRVPDKWAVEYARKILQSIRA